MIETEGLDDLLNELSMFGETVEDAVETSLQDIASTLPSEMAFAIFGLGGKRNRTYNLSRSLDASVVNGNQLNFQMLDYGYYQVFGVKGRKSRNIFGLSDSVARTFDKREGDTFAFRRIAHPGIAGVAGAVNILDGLSDLIAETITTDL